MAEMSAGQCGAGSAGVYVRVLRCGQPQALEHEALALQAGADAVRAFGQAAAECVVKIKRLPPQQAHDLCRTFGAAGIHCLSGKAPDDPECCADVLISGGPARLDEAAASLTGPPLADVGQAITFALRRARSTPHVPAESASLPPALARMFSEMRRRTLVMGILNVTPDSFSDGGRYGSVGQAVEWGVRMVADGADIIDVGGESTRPGAEPVSEQEEISRIAPVITSLAQSVEVPISVDTWKPAVACAATQAGASIVNDVTGLQYAPETASVAAEAGAALIIMHMRGTPRTMQKDPHYANLMDEVCEFLHLQTALAVASGVPEEMIILDPGFGFAKTPEHNLEILRCLREFTALGRPLLMGTSRKSTLGQVMGGAPPLDRLEATAATVAVSIMNGARIVRVHDVLQMARVARMTDAIMQAPAWG